MKTFKSFLILTVIFLYACSFDNKTGIWRDLAEEEVQSLTKKSKTKIFNKEIKNNNKSVQIDNKKKIINWKVDNYNNSNNIPNVTFNDEKVLTKLSTKLSKSRNKNDIFFFDEKIISYDHKGTIFVYSIDENKKVFEYNFYKKAFKNSRKNISLAVDNNIIFASDNFGYLYALDIKNQKIKWAKNFGIPFRSNLKVKNDILFLANQENVLYAIDINNGDKLWELSTNFKLLKSKFKNNIATSETNVIFLNTSGELYSINIISNKIEWVQNFSNSTSGGSNLFLSSPVIISNKNIIITTNDQLYQLDINTGNIILKLNIILDTKPLITNNNIIVLTPNKFLICINRSNGEIIWSKNFLKELVNMEKRFKIGKINGLYAVNSNIVLISKTGYLIKLNFNNGEIIEIVKFLQKSLGSNVLFANNKIFALDSQKKLFEYK